MWHEAAHARQGARGTVLLPAIALLSFSVVVSPGVQAWSNGGYSSDPLSPDYGTHDWIADMALLIQVKDVTFLTRTYHAKFLLGTEAPDNPAYIGDTANHHVYYYSSGVLQDDKSAARALQVYRIALGYLVAGDLENAAYYIGVMSHYIADVGVFGHTMGSGTDWGNEIHHSDYESFIEAMVGSLESPTGLTLADIDAYRATLGLAKNVTFGNGLVMSNVWMDTHYDWTDATFVASAMASLYGSIAAVAGAINHLLTEAEQVVVAEFDDFALPIVVFMICIAATIRRTANKSLVWGKIR